MSNEVDPFEEFEFKPITDGLGFHRKSAKLNTTTKKQSTSSMDDLLGDAIDRDTLFSTPLPTRKTKQNAVSISADSMDERSHFSQTNTHSQSHDIVDEILKNIETSKQKSMPSFMAQKSEAKIIGSRPEPTYKPSGPLLTAIFLDLMLVAASSLLFLVALLAITKIDLLMNIKNPDDQGAVYLSLFLLFSSVSFIYYLVFRAFLSYTPGEWAYDQKLQINGGKVDFFVMTKIALRSILIFVTGGFVLPLVSWVFGKDLLGQFLELPLVRRK